MQKKRWNMFAICSDLLRVASDLNAAADNLGSVLSDLIQNMETYISVCRQICRSAEGRLTDAEATDAANR